MDKYDAIETYQCRIEISNLIQTICHLQDDNKQDAMAAVEKNKKVYLFYQVPYQSNADYLEAFKAHLKVTEAHNGVVVHHPGLSVIVLQEKHNITSNISSEDQNIEANIRDR